MIKLMFLFLFVLTGCQISTPSHGSKVGRIVKLSNEGLFNTTLEGELIRGGFNDGSGAMGNSFHFTIEDYKLKEIAYEAFETQKEVILTYECELFSAKWRSEDSHPKFVKSIKLK